VENARSKLNMKPLISESTWYMYPDLLTISESTWYMYADLLTIKATDAIAGGILHYLEINFDHLIFS
jgi:hypothetical protein